MFKIEIADQQELLEIDYERVTQIASGTLAAEGVQEAELSIALVDDVEIREVNRKYLGHDYATDVVSFLLESDGPAALDVPRARGMKLAGEVVISTQTALACAAQYGWDAHDECLLYLVHGVLHLCGYDDQTDEERVVMRAREAEVLSRWDLVPRYA